MSFFYPRSVRGKLLVNEPARRILWYVDEFQIRAALDGLAALSEAA